MWTRAAADPAVDPATSLDPVDRSRVARFVLWLKVAAAALEIGAGLTLVILGIIHINIAAWARHLAMRELQQDPGDFIARHVIASFYTLTRVREILDGAVLAVYGALKAGVVLAVLRHHHRVAIFGAVLFTLVAVGAAIVLFRHPTAVRAVLGVLDVAVAVVLCREALSLRHHMRST